MASGAGPLLEHLKMAKGLDVASLAPSMVLLLRGEVLSNYVIIAFRSSRN